MLNKKVFLILTLLIFLPFVSAIAPEFGRLALTQNLTGNVAGESFGWSATTGDINNDNYDDIIIGAGGYKSYQGRALLYIGNSSGELTLQQNLTGGVAGESFGAKPITGDINNDNYDDVIIGAYNYNSGQGRALLYLGNSSGELTLQQNLTGNVAGEYFGISTATGDINNDNYNDVIIGAYNYNSGQGRALLYLGNSSGQLSLKQNLTGNNAGEWFGDKIATGDINNDNYMDLIIGAIKWDGCSAGNDCGRVLLYLGNSSGELTLQQNLTGNIANEYFSTSAATSDINNDNYNDIIIGAYNYNSGQGRALLYLGNSSGELSLKQNLTGNNAGEWFGNPIATGDTNNDNYMDFIIVAEMYPNGGGDGRALLYLGNSSGELSLRQNLTSSIGSFESFGYAPATGDINNDNYDDVVLGAYYYNNGQGRALLYKSNFKIPNKQWNEDASLTNALDLDDYFIDNDGDSLTYTATGNTIITVSIGSDGVVNFSQPADWYGTETIYFTASDGESTADSNSITLTVINNIDDDPKFGKLFLAQNLTGNVAGEGFGDLLAISNINNDNYDDVIIGAYSYNSYQGRSLLYFGNSSGGLTLQQNLTGNVAAERFGDSATTGDINNDNYNDVIIGAMNYNSNQGRALLYLGNSSDGLTLQQNLTGNVAGEFFSSSATTGDINNDNYTDVIIGAFSWDGCAAGDNCGRALLYLGNSSGGLTLQQNLTGNVAGDYFGYSIATGDINNDNYDDVIIGSTGYPPGDYNGRALIYLGNSSGEFTLQQNLTGNNVGEWFGYSIATGDINNDNYDDVIIGAIGYQDGNWNGRALLYLGNSSGELTLQQNLTGNNDGEEFGISVAVGDINNDNYVDVLIGADGYPNEGYDGRALLYLGNSSGELTLWQNLTGIIGSEESFSYATATGNINNDNYDDVVIGAYNYNNGQGRALLYKSNFNIPNQIWNEDTSLANAFNLNNYFSDTNNDTLIYTVTGNSNIQVSINSNGIVTFSQPADWYGSETIYFTASDGISEANSNIITLTVNDVEEDAAVQTYTSSSAADATSSSPAIGSTTNPHVSYVWNELTAGDTAVLNIKKTKISFTKVEITVNNDFRNAEVRVESMAAPSSSTKPTETKVYQYLDVKKRNIDEENIEKIAIQFKVSNSWLDDHNVNKDQIVLKSYKDGEWKDLPTILVSGNKITGNAILLKNENNVSFFTAFISLFNEIFAFLKNTITGFAIQTTFVLYEAESDSLGSFAVAVKEKPAEKEPEPCIEIWKCTDWSLCTYDNQERECKDINNCNTFENKPAERRECIILSPSPVEKPVDKVLSLLISIFSIVFLIFCYYAYLFVLKKSKGKK